MKELEFHRKHGKNTTDRMVPKLLEAIMVCLEANGIQLEGKHIAIKRLGKGVGVDAEGSLRLIFDVLNPSVDYDHIEFTVEKTGWGRSYMQGRVRYGNRNSF